MESDKDNLNNRGIAIVFNNAARSRKPISATLELTTRCNYDCVHCYLKGIHNKTMSKENAFIIIKKIKEAGGMFLTLTGGEALLHPDFKEIYTFAIKSGLMVTVLTNGYLIDDSIMVLFGEYKPRKIEVTIYGMRDESFKTVTGTDYNYAKVLDNVKRLKAQGHNVLIKAILLKQNRDDIIPIKKWAKEQSCMFQYDYNILPTINGDFSVIDNQVDEQELVRFELEYDENCRDKWKYKMAEYDFDNNKKTDCGCGLFSYMVSVEGIIRQCNFMENDNDNSLLKNDLFDIWDKWDNIKQEKRIKFSQCLECKYQPLCDICPSMAYAFGKNSERYMPIERLCKIARFRHGLINGED